MDDERYLTEEELTGILDIITALKSFKSEIYLNANISDLSGEHLGSVRYGEAGYAYYPNGEASRL